MTVGLAGCETGASLFGSSSDTPSVALADQSSTAATQPARIAIAQVLGPPENVRAELEAQLASEIEKQNIAVAKSPTQKAEYTVRGYVTSALAKKGAKANVEYVWDVTDATGKVVHRVDDKATTSAAKNKNPWDAVTPQVVQEITAKTVASIAKWLPKQAPVAPAVASGSSGTPLVETANAVPKPSSAPPLAAPSQVPAAAPNTITGSINRAGPFNTRVPSVTGAPGDGSNSLRSALQRELERGGMKLAQTPSPSTYTVEGKVSVGPGKDGKQPIAIDWDVKDPQGKKLGTVSQKNNVAQGSLDGAWGKTADAAAAAAAQGILKLLPRDQTTSSN